MKLEEAWLDIGDVDAIKTHNPFAVNDVYFSRQTGARPIAELIEVLRRRGGGTGLFTGCAAGDAGAALVLRVED